MPHGEGIPKTLEHIVASNCASTLFNTLDEDIKTQSPQRQSFRKYKSNAKFSATAFLAIEDIDSVPDYDTELRMVESYMDFPTPQKLKGLTTLMTPMVAAAAQNLAQRYNIKNHEEDIFQTGMSGVLTTIPKFKLDQNTRMSSFLRYVIAGDMIAYAFRYKHIFRTNSHSEERKAFFFFEREQALLDKLKSRLMMEDVQNNARTARYLGISEKRAKSAFQSLNMDIRTVSDIPEESAPSPFNDCERVRTLIAQILENSSRKFSKRDVEIFVRMSTCDDKPMCTYQMGRRYGLTRTRIGQIHKEMIQKMKDVLQAKGITHMTDIMECA
jgi:RNA polymerase sigma factor (sigma-70 family)